MQLKTERLVLHPLTAENLNTARKNLPAVARSLGVTSGHVGFWESMTKKRIYSAKLDIIDKFPNAWLLSTTWLITANGEVVGEAGFKGPPDRNDAIEIGYSMRENFRNRGYMTEAVDALTRFAFDQTGLYVGAVTALTLPENVASHSVLIKNGFVKQPSFGKYWFWSKNRDVQERQA